MVNSLTSLAKSLTSPAKFLISPAKSFTTLPYIKGASDKIKRVLNGVGVKVALKPLLTIGKFLPSLKDPLVAEKKSCLVYQVPCKDCSFIYLGQTKKGLKSRVSEHQRAIKFQRPEKSALCEHSISLNHTINWSEVEILKTETDYSKRLFAESWFINEKPEVVNRNDGQAFPLVYKKLLKS